MGPRPGDNSIELLLGDVSQELGDSWRQVGRRLGLLEAELENIQHDYSSAGGQAEMGYQVLLRWRQRNGLAELASAMDRGLREATRVDLAEKFGPRLQGIVTEMLSRSGTSDATISLADTDKEDCMIQELRNYYTRRSKVPMVPWAGKGGKIVTVELETVYTNLELLIDIDHPYLPLRIPLRLDKLFDEVRTGDTSGEVGEVATKSGTDERRGGRLAISSQRVVARGRTGSGKTTLLLKMADDWADQRKGPLNDVKAVFLLPLKKLDYMNNLGDAIVNHLLPSKSFTPQFVEEFIQANQKSVAVLLDGYDEFKGKGLDQQQCGNIVKMLRNEYLPDVRVFVTTRPGRVGDFLGLPDDIADHYRHLEITGFSSQDIDAYVKKMFMHEQNLADKLLKYLEENHLKTELASLPLMCCAFCQLTKFTDGQNFKDMNTINTLFDKLIRCLLQYHSQSKDQRLGSVRTGRGRTRTWRISNGSGGTRTRNMTDENNNLLLELGKVALAGFFRAQDESQTKELIFSRRDFQGCKPGPDEIIARGCETGILYHDVEAEYVPTEYEDFEINNDDIDESARSFNFVLKMFQEKLAGKYLAHLASGSEEEQQRFKDYVESIETMQRAIDLGNVLMFACGANLQAARAIFERIAGLLLPKAANILDFMEGKLHYNQCHEVQKLVEFCLQLNFESQTQGRLNDVLALVFFGCTRIRLIGISSYVIKSLGYLLEHSKGLPVKSLELIRLRLNSSSEFREFLNTFHGLEDEVATSMNKKRRTKHRKKIAGEMLTEEKRKEMLQDGTSNGKYLLQRTDDVFLTLLPVWQNVNKMQISEWNFKPVIEGLKNCPLEELILNGVKADPADWERLFSTIGDATFNSLQKLTMGMTDIEDEHLAKLVPAIRSQKKLRYLKLSGNEVGLDFLEAFEVSDRMTALETLILDKTDMDVEALEYLGEILPCFPSLSTLDVRRNEGSNDVSIGSILDNVQHCPDMKCLMISLHHVTDNVLRDLHAKISPLTELRELHLVHTPDPEMVIRRVRDILPHLSRLEDLRISSKPPDKTKSQSTAESTEGQVSLATAKAFADAIVKCPSLRFVSLLYATLDKEGFLYLLQRCTEATAAGLETLRFSSACIPKDDVLLKPVREAEKKFLRIWV